jgi:CTP synthase
MIFSGKAPDYPIMQILELPRHVHPYFVGTQAHPEFQSRPLRPQPMFRGLVKAGLEHARNSERKTAGAPSAGIST